MILRAALDELAPESKLPLAASDAQQYFGEWTAQALGLQKQHGDEWLLKYRPAMHLLLEMMEKSQ